MEHQANVGTGPGVVTPDGCAVDFYAPLPPVGENLRYRGARAGADGGTGADVGGGAGAM